MLDETTTIKDFLAATADRTPTPGGGAVAALAGALSSALAEMVINYSIGKKDLADYDTELKTARSQLDHAGKYLAQLMAQDQDAFTALSAAKKAGQPGPIAAAVRNCVNVPREVAVTALATLDLCDRMAGKVNRFLYSDLSIAANLAMATVRCSVQNIRANLPDIADAEMRKTIEAENE